MLIKEQPTQLFYDAVDIRNARNEGYWKGMLVAGTVLLVVCGAIGMFVLH